MRELKGKIKDWIRYGIVFCLAKLFPIEEKVVFRSFGGKQYSDNPRAISEKLHELYPEIKIVWILSGDIKELPSYVSKISTRSFKYFYDMATMQCFIYNVELSGLFYKRRGQRFIQTWHGDRGIKKCLYQVDDNLNITDNKYTDIYMTGSEYGEKFSKEAFHYHGNFTRYGSARNDILLNHTASDIVRIKNSIGLKQESKVVLFAPTFNDNSVLEGKNEQVQVDLNRVLNALEKKYGGDWVCLVRAHSCSCGLDLDINENRILDVTSYFDMADLLLISDWLLSDYSSSLGDFILMDKPAILVDFNREKYISSRKLDVELEKVGYKMAHNQQELEKIIYDTSLDEFMKCCDSVKKYYNVYDTGEASTRIAQYIKSEGEKTRKK